MSVWVPSFGHFVGMSSGIKVQFFLGATKDSAPLVLALHIAALLPANQTHWSSCFNLFTAHPLSSLSALANLPKDMSTIDLVKTSVIKKI